MADGQCVIFVGAIFQTFEELQNAVFSFGRSQSALFVMGDSRKSKLCNAGSQSYEYLTFVCKQGGKMRPSRSKGIRPNQSSLKCGCPVKVRAVALRNADGTVGYRITQAVLEHNHPTSEMVFQAYPENRRAYLTESLEALLNCPSISNKDLRQHIQDSQQKTLLASDIRNLKLKMAAKVSLCDTSEVEGFINKIVNEGGTAEYGLNEDGSFQYLAYMTADMKKLLNLYPECLVMDSTYNTNVYLLPLTTAMCIDSEGSGHPVMHAFVHYEDNYILQKCLLFFKNQYDSSKTSAFYVDKDFAGISVLSNIFPDASVSLCLFHIKKAVKQSLQGKNLPSHLVSCILDLFLQQQSVFTEEEFSRVKAEIQAIAPPHIVEYFEHNWWMHPDRWAVFRNLHAPQLHLVTTNHLKSYHSKIKSSLHSKLPLSETLKIVHNYDKQLLRSACVRDALCSIRRKYNTADSDPVIGQITNDLSVFAAKFACHQYHVSQKITYEVTHVSGSDYAVAHPNDTVCVCSLTGCSCKSFVNMKLPCRHMFFLRRFLGKPLYEPVGMDHRFSRHCSSLKQDIEVSEGSVVSKVSNFQNRKSVVTFEEKFLTAEKLMSQFSSYLTLLGTSEFYRRLNQLDTLLSFWKNNQNVMFLETEDCPDDTSVRGSVFEEGVGGRPIVKEGVTGSVTEGGVGGSVVEGGVSGSVVEGGVGGSVVEGHVSGSVVGRVSEVGNGCKMDGFSSVILRPVKTKGRTKAKQTFTKQKRKAKMLQTLVSYDMQ